MPGLLLAGAGAFSLGAADAPLTGITLPIRTGAKGVDRLETSFGRGVLGSFYTEPGRVPAVPNNVPGVRAWSPPV
jgi:hypothetical protein